jgi:methanogenic corrinoid protein MtbC1
MTGIAIDTLRAWERRHGAVTPVRDERGRMYRQSEIDRLRLLRVSVAHGHGIGRIAGLSDKQLRLLAATAAAAPPTDRQHPTSVDTSAIDAALSQYDATGIDREIARLAAVLSPLDLLEDVLMPLLAQVGDEWHRRRTGIAREHLMSSTIRNILGSFLRLHARQHAPARLLFATPSGDRHEIGTLGAAMLAASSGLGVTYMGPDLSARDILDSLKPAGADVLVLGVTTTAAGKTLEAELRTIVRLLPKNIELWAGGPGANKYAALVGRRGLVLHDYDTYQKELVRLGGRTL